MSSRKAVIAARLALRTFHSPPGGAKREGAISGDFSGETIGRSRRESGGRAVAVSDKEILEAQAVIAKLAGVLAEPAAATSVAAAKKLSERGVIDRDDIIVCNLTGDGLKQPGAIQFSETEFAPIAPTLNALREEIAGSPE